MFGEIEHVALESSIAFDSTPVRVGSTLRYSNPAPPARADSKTETQRKKTCEGRLSIDRSSLTVLHEGEDRVPHEVGRDLAEVDQQPAEDDEGHQKLTATKSNHRNKAVRGVRAVLVGGYYCPSFCQQEKHYDTFEIPQ